MESKLNTDETRLFDLIESSAYDDLSSRDREFVALHLTEEEYRLRRLLINGADHLFKDDLQPLPLQLDIAAKKSRVIPLYQALLAVASVIIIFLLIWPGSTSENTNAELLKPKNRLSAVKTEYIHDTVVKYVPEYRYVAGQRDTVVVYVTETVVKQAEEPKLLELSQSFPLPSLDRELIANKGNSLREDQSSRFIIPVKLSD